MLKERAHQITGKIADVANDIDCGDLNALEGYLHLKYINDVLSSALKQVQPLAIMEAETYSEKTFKAFDCEIQLKSAAGRWNFKNVDAWNFQKDKLNDIEEAAKIAFKQNGKGVDLVDRNGELITAAEFTPGKDTIAIKTGVV